jgi:hypothetical protein
MKRIHGWKCDTCGEFDTPSPWACPGCGVEVCEHCFCKLMHCGNCAAFGSDESLAAAADAMYGTEFSDLVRLDAD